MSEGAIPDAALGAPARGPEGRAPIVPARVLHRRSPVARLVGSLLLLFCLAFLGTLATTQGAAAHEGHSRAPAAARQAARAVPDSDRDCDGDCCKTSMSRGCCAHAGQSGLANAAGFALLSEPAALAFPRSPQLPHDSRALAPEPAPPRPTSA